MTSIISGTMRKLKQMVELFVNSKQAELEQEQNCFRKFSEKFSFLF